ncbi:unnamed protein product [Chrysodeixis includens]|uniref:Uncharacterized protein n=1 Tax=Chrysodeixis includens TaxID=689277 RepID=A0A9N8Q062_CHRIL|nr:unnamed protein product [Chrysodeixis includens]
MSDSQPRRYDLVTYAVANTTLEAAVQRQMRTRSHALQRATMGCQRGAAARRTIVSRRPSAPPPLPAAARHRLFTSNAYTENDDESPLYNYFPPAQLCLWL